MPVIRFTEVAADLFVIGGEFPFCFGRQARSGPLCISVSLVITDMGHRRMQIEIALTAERKFGIETFGPVKRSVPTLPVDGRPAIGMPELRIRISASADKAEKFAVVDKT